MVELTKEQLLYHFPYTPQSGNQVKENKTIYDVVCHIEALLWRELSTGNDDRPADLELKLIDYQSDIASRKKHFKGMREELSEEMQKRQKELAEKRNKIYEEYLPEDFQVRQQQNIPWSVSDDPKAFAKAYKEMMREFEDLTDEINRIDDNFQQQMESASKLKLQNTDPFDPEELQELNGKLIKAVRPLVDAEKEPA